MTPQDFIKRHEGFRSRPYTDSLGHLTAGFGRALDRNPLTPAEGEYLFQNDYTRAVNAAMAAVGPDVFSGLGLVRQTALICMAFQLGAQGLSEFKAMVAAIQAGDWQTARREALDSRWADQTQRRAHECAEMLLTNQWPK
jgi:lysozyme